MYNMRKILLLAAVAMMTATGAPAQGYDYETKHEVAVSYGIDSNSQIIDAFEEIGGATLRKEKYDSDNDSRDYDDSAVHVNRQLSFVGIEAGSPAIRAFAELGFLILLTVATASTMR